jgi:AcrR family transcriptional regulator
VSTGVKRDNPARTTRADQARATRRRIVDHAARLFVEQGYAATTLAQIAEEAGVAVQTVYFHFGNKATLLKEIVDVSATGDDEPVPVLERPWVRRMRDERDGRKALAIWLRNARTIFGRAAPIMRIVRDAAGSDPEMAAQWQTNLDQRYQAQRAMAEQLAAKDALRPDVAVDQASDIMFSLVSFEVYLLLTGERGWTPTRWERWLTATLTTTMLR